MNQIILIGLFVFFAPFAWSQSSTYVSAVDKELSITKWTLYPLVDNLDGIYSRPLQTELQALMNADPEFEFVAPIETKKVAPEEFEEKRSLAVQFIKDSKVDAFWAGRIARGPSGISIRLALFSGDQGYPLLIESRGEIQSYDVSDIKQELQKLYRQTKAKIPYRGLILSRRGQQVTMNLGKSSGLREGQDVESIQVTKMGRHPRFNFLVSTEKEIMGKIRVTKVDEKLSFGSILSERTEGQLQPGAKITFNEVVKYPGVPQLKDGTLIGDLNSRADSGLAFGDNPKEWSPMSPPSFGKVALLLGMGSYSLSNNLTTNGSVSSRSSLVPSFHVEGEMWLSANWFLGLELHQYVAKVDNQLTGSSPSSLELQTLEAELVGGYNVLVSEEFWGPKLQFMFGLSQMDSKIEDSTPTAFTSMKYGGMALGLAGSIPLGEEVQLPISVGGKFMYYWSPSLSESPTSSGNSSSSRISTFSIFSEWQTTARLALKGELSFRQYNTNFSGGGTRFDSASSAAHAMTTLAGGVVFLF
ncbi:MAG: hypothetical protein ACK5P7_01550 [Bdellovibrio sp.]